MNARTDEEQIETLKRFMQEYGSKLLLVLLAAIASLFGYQSWQSSQQAAQETASIYYSELSMLASSETALDEQQRNRFDEVFARLAKEYPGSTYASYAAFYKASLEVKGNALDEAAKTLRWVLDNNPDKNMVALARLRLARVELARDNLAEARALLENDAGALAPLYEHVRGDIYLQQGEQQKALLAYKKAQSLAGDTPTMSASLLEMKIGTLDAAGSDKVFRKADPADAQ